MAAARAGDGEAAWRSTDGGATWRALAAPVGRLGGRADVALAADGTVYVADFGAGSPVLARYVDGSLAGWIPIAHAGATIERPWIAAGPPSRAAGATGGHEILVSTLDAAPRGMALLRSLDGAVSPATARVELSAIGNLGGTATPVAIDPESGRAYAAVAENGRLFVAAVSPGGAIAEKRAITTATSATNRHAVTAVDEAGNVFVAWSAPSGGTSWDVFVASSRDGGRSWSAPFKLSDGGANVYPWIDARQPGRVVVAWYGSEAKASPESNAGPWRVRFAQSVDLLESAPTRTLSTLPDVVHADRGLCLSRCGRAPEGRHALGDFLGVAIDDEGWAHVAYATSVDGETRVVHVAQTGGTPS